jgi:uncharacterized protein with von Willebrand factor type A (vWA) domain
MFNTLPHTFRKHQLSADVRTLLHLRKAMQRGLINTIGDMYLVLRGLVTTTQKEFGPFTKAFYEYFLQITINKGESLNSAIVRSELFKEWRKAYEEELEDKDDFRLTDMVDQFLDEVHRTTFDIKKFFSGEDILENDNPDAPDNTDQENVDEERELDRMADYSNIPLEALRRRMERIARQQKRKHRGGNHWIGQGGISPYGNNGAAAGGIRVGGSGGGKMARAVLNDSNYYPADTKAILSDDNIDAALTVLKGIEEESTEIELDVPKTIKEGVKIGGLFLPHLKEKTDQKVQVMLIIDNGGYSMSPYIRNVQKLFSKMKTRFAHDLKVFYYHNTIYGGVYAEAARRTFVPVDKLITNDKNYSIFIIGDADMAPYELTEASQLAWYKLTEHFKRIAWLNPMAERFWAMSDTVPVLRSIFEMHPLSPEGIEKAVAFMNSKRQFYKK